MSTPTSDGFEIEPKAKLSNARIIFRIILVVAVLVGIVQVLGPNWTRVMSWGLDDNDDAMRVLQVRDWLAGQTWFDLSQHRLNPPQGGDMHWSRLGDFPLATLMWPLSILFGIDKGAKYAAFFTPVMLGFLYVWVGARTAASLAGRGAFLPGIILVACAPAALVYFMPGRVDHHGLQMILIAGAIWGLTAGGGRAAALAGMAIATGICIGLEALPLQIVLIGWVAARWGLRGDDVKGATLGFGLGFAVALGLLFAATVPVSKWALPVNDAVGRGYVVLGCLGGVLLTFAAQTLGRFNLVGRAGTLAVIGLLVLSGIKFFPEIIIPPYGKVDPLLMRLWLSNVNETEPLITTKLSIFLSFALFPLCAAVGALIGVALTKDKERDVWILAALAVIAAAAFATFWQLRVAGLATAVSSIIAAAILAKTFERFSWKVALGVAVVVNPIVPALTGSAIARVFEPTENKYQTGGGQNCFREGSFSALAAMPTGLVVAPIDMGARVMLTTRHQVLAAPYHRNNRGNLASYHVFLLPQDQAKERANQLNANYLAICKRSAEVVILSREAPKGLMADLKAGRVPDWLTPIPSPKGSDVQAFKIKSNP